MHKILLAVPLALLVSACAPGALPDPTTGADPADPLVAPRTPAAMPVFDGYVHRAAVDPKPWRQMNDGQAPAGQGGGS